MSFSLIEYPWNSPLTVTTSGVFTFDLLIDKNYPALELEGTEPNAIYFEMREVSGALWIVQNAQYNGTNWIPQNTALPSYALVITSGGALQYLYSPLGTNPCNFTVLTNLTEQSGFIASVAADGSAASTVTYPVAFANSTDTVLFGISNNFATNSWQLGSPQAKSITATGFEVTISGGPSGSTVGLYWLVKGH